MRYRGRKAKSLIDWDTIDFVVGTRDDVTRTDIHRPCHRCGHDVFTSRQYPERISMICEVCALEIAEEEEAAGRKMTATLSPTFEEDIINFLDPWRRVVESGAIPPPPTKNALAPTKSPAAPTKDPSTPSKSALPSSRRRSRPRSGTGDRTTNR